MNSQPDAGGSPPMVSVIVPVFNKEAFLSACIDSLLNQTLESLELICVNDGSTDRSGELLHAFAQHDGRVQLISNPVNIGAGRTRNLGLYAAKGAYVLFADADDVIPANALATLVELAKTDGVDAVCGSVEGFRTDSPDQHKPMRIAPTLSRARPLDNPDFWVPWWHTSFLFSRRFLLDNKIVYPDLRIGEDPVFLAAALTKLSRLSSTPDVVYRYRLGSPHRKDRATFEHLGDYLAHAQIIRDLFLRAMPDAWHRGFEPVVSSEIDKMIDNWELTASQRVMARQLSAKLFGPQQAKTR